MLIIDDLHVTYEGQSDAAVNGLSCAWETNGLVAIVGRSGVGKSTLLQCIAGIQAAGMPTVARFRGRVVVDGSSPCGVRGPRNVSWVPQAPALLDHLSVVENVLLPLTTAEGDEGPMSETAALTLIGELGMAEQVRSRPRQLSGGMKTRVSLARALVSEPRYLYLDEPFSSLDLSNRWALYKLIRERRVGDGMATLFTSHNIPESALIADKIVVIARVGDRTTATVIANKPTLRKGIAAGECLEAARVIAAPIEADVFLALGQDPAMA